MDIPDISNNPQDTMGTVQKKVLLEELTGVSCPNCPAGTAALESILTVFGKRVVSNAIHGKFLAQPTSSNIYDFRNPDAEDLENYLAPFLGKPAAVIDRVLFDGQDFRTVDNIGLWQSLVQQQLNEQAIIAIEMDQSYDENTRRADIDVTVTALEDIQGNIKLSVLVNENGIIDAQSNQTEIIASYEHNHVMRDMLSSIQGDLIFTDISAGEVISRSYSYTVPNQNINEWIPENMDIISFITASERDNQVLQAEAVPMIE